MYKFKKTLVLITIIYFINLLFSAQSEILIIPKKKAEIIDKNLQPLHKALFIESNPAPVKYAAKILGLCSDEIRLPLVKIKKETEKEVYRALSSTKLIN